MNKFKGRLMNHMRGDSQGSDQSVVSFGPQQSRTSLDLEFGGGSDDEWDGFEIRPSEGSRAVTGGRHGHRLAHIIADNSNCLWLTWMNGRVDRYSFNGKLEMKKVGSEVSWSLARFYSLLSTQEHNLEHTITFRQLFTDSTSS